MVGACQRGFAHAGEHEPGIAFTRDGTALLSANAVTRPGDPFSGRVVSLAPSGATREAVVGQELAADPVIDGRGRVALLSLRSLGALTRLRISFGSAADPVQANSHVLATYAPARAELGDRPAIAVSERGEIAVAWVQFVPRASIHRLRLAVRPPGRAFRRTRTLATADGVIQDAALTYDRAGRLLVAYGAERSSGRRLRRTVEARLRGARGEFRRAEVLGPHDGVAQISAAMAPAGRAVVAWDSQDGGEGAEKPYRVRAAIRAPGSRAFGRTQLLDPGATSDRVPGRSVLGVAPDGSATVAWSNVVGASTPVRVAAAGPRTRFGPTVQAAPDGAVGDLAVGGDGSALLLWNVVTEIGVAGGPIQAALRPPGAPAFGNSETVVAPGPAQLSLGRAAFDPATGRPAVVWARHAEPGAVPPLWLSSRAP